MTYSVITACLNSGQTINATIASVLAQTPVPKEYIFVDGGSSDNTRGIILAAMAEAQRQALPIAFRTIDQVTKGGITEAWNIGIAVAKGDAVFILNSDDWYVPNAAAYVLAQFERDASTGIFLGAGRCLKSREHRQGEIVYNRPFAVLPFAMPAVHPACFVRRKVYEQIGPLNARYKLAADYEFVFRARRAGVQFFVSRKVLVNILRGGFAENNRKLARDEMLQIGKSYSRFFPLPYIAYILRVALGR